MCEKSWRSPTTTVSPRSSNGDDSIDSHSRAAGGPWRVPLLLVIMTQLLFSALAAESPPNRLRIAGVVFKSIRTGRVHRSELGLELHRSANDATSVSLSDGESRSVYYVARI